MMKKIQFTTKILCALILLLGSSCEKWLSVSPESEVKYDDLFSYKNGFKDQLTGVYTALCTEQLYGANLTYGMLDVLGQQYVWTQEVGKYYYLNRFEYSNPNSLSVITDVWNKMYSSIANVNILIKAVGDNPGILSEEEERIYKGEALALRAFLHFDLLRVFGKSMLAGADTKAIPYVTSISKDVTELSTVKEVLKLLIADLKEASILLEDDPIKTGVGTNKFLGNRSFHFNYYAVQALLARAYLYIDDKPNALLSAELVMNSTKFPWVLREKVTTSTRETRDGTFVSEGIFILNNTQLDALTGKYLREGLTTDNSNLLVTSAASLTKIFEADKFGGFDWRYNYYFEVQRNFYHGSSKLWQYKSMPVAYQHRQPLIRISEMYLIAAESTPDKSQAVAYFNNLRQHRGFDKSLDLQNTISDQILSNEISKEYQKEFIGEGQWFFYCKRKDREDMPLVTVPFSKGFYVLPLPDLEIEYGNRN